MNAYFDAEEERKEIEDEEEEEERKEAKDSVRRRVVSWVKVKVGDAEAQRIATRQAFRISVMAVIKRAKIMAIAQSEFNLFRGRGYEGQVSTIEVADIKSRIVTGEFIPMARGGSWA